MGKVYVVDGYNVIYKYPKIFKCKGGLHGYSTNIKHCREELVRFIIKHNANKKDKIILVFDGKGEKNYLDVTKRQLQERYNIEVLFSDRNKNETADDVISKIVAGKKYKNLVVVTEDIALARKLRILQSSTEIMSPSKFLFKSRKRLQASKSEFIVDAKLEAKIIEEFSQKYDIEEEIKI